MAALLAVVFLLVPWTLKLHWVLQVPFWAASFYLMGTVPHALELLGDEGMTRVHNMETEAFTYFREMWRSAWRALWIWVRSRDRKVRSRVDYLLRLLHVIEEGGCWDWTVQLIYYLENSRIIPSLLIIIAPADLRQVGSRALFDSRPPAVRQLSLISHRLVPGLSLQRTPNGQDHLGEWLRHDRQVLTFLPIEALMPAHLPFSGAARAAAAMKKGSEHLADAAKGTVVGCLGRQVRALAALPPEQLSMRIDEFKGSLTGSADILSPAYCPSCNDEEARVLDDMATLAALAERLDGQRRKALLELFAAGGKDSVHFPVSGSSNLKVNYAATALTATLTDEIATVSVYQSDPPTKGEWPGRDQTGGKDRQHVTH
uniref:Uncharacterized protein n=1 Tax=Vitrella brassicaformis TaxID=1169539 RepID=A0A7S1JVF7_9ALVE